jgi:hypothetical protein
MALSVPAFETPDTGLSTGGHSDRWLFLVEEALPILMSCKCMKRWGETNAKQFCRSGRIRKLIFRCGPTIICATQWNSEGKTMPIFNFLHKINRQWLKVNLKPKKRRDGRDKHSSPTAMMVKHQI